MLTITYQALAHIGKKDSQKNVVTKINKQDAGA